MVSRRVAFWMLLTIGCGAMSCLPVLAKETVYIGENDTLVFDRDGGNPILQRTIGVGQTSRKGSQDHFSAVLTDLLPQGAHVISPEGSTWPAQTLCQEQYSVSVEQRETDAGRALDMTFQDAPCVTAAEQASCCGCGGGPCGKACSVNVCYRAAWPGVDSDQWARAGFNVSPSRLVVGTANTVRVEIFTKLNASPKGTLMMWIPKEVDNATVTVAFVSEDAEVQYFPGGTTVRLSHTTERGHLVADLTVTPGAAGRIVLSDALKAYVTSPTALSPGLSVSDVGGKKVERTSNSVVLFKKSIVMTAE